MWELRWKKTYFLGTQMLLALNTPSKGDTSTGAIAKVVGRAG